MPLQAQSEGSDGDSISAVGSSDGVVLGSSAGEEILHDPDNDGGAGLGSSDGDEIIHDPDNDGGVGLGSSDDYAGGVGRGSSDGEEILHDLDNDGVHVSDDDSQTEVIVIKDMVDIMKIDMRNFSAPDIARYEFAELDVAYMFYTWFARNYGFSVRKGQVIRNRFGDVVQQTFLCSCEGFRNNSGLTVEERKRESKNATRCGCMAKLRVHVNILSKRWYVTVFVVDHNHELNGTLVGLLPAYRKISECDIQEIGRNMRVGVRPYQVYGTMANIAGGFQKVGFVKNDLYNQIGRQRNQFYTDASDAVKYLRGLKAKDPLMFVTHSTDTERRLERLFFCDGESRMNYDIFGDVIAFDATYRKNKYNCPFVIFSGVNHHNQTIVFGTGIVISETEETYVWLLEQLLSAMNGKQPLSVITDGDLAMKNAIKRVFPNAHHRLCAWHLLRNASTNIGIPEFMSYLKRCMLSDVEVSKFESLWAEMVEKFGLQDNSWIKEMYDKRQMWATAHIRGSFFAGLRTTSRCEALHGHMGQFVHSRINMTDFVQQFHRCLTYFRFREIQSDFESNYGSPVLQTSLRGIEKSASKKFSKEIFMMFRTVLKKAMLLRITDSQEMSTGSIFKVMKYCGGGSEWSVAYCEEPIELKCSCLRMESLGLPCDHIVAVLMCLDFDDIPDSLVLPRWSKFAKDSIRERYASGSLYWDSQPAARYSGIVHLCKLVAELVYEDPDEYNRVIDMLGGEISRLKLRTNRATNDPTPVSETGTSDPDILDPHGVRTKGCGAIPSGTPGGRRRTQTCSVCGVVGHNRRCCPQNNVNHVNGHVMSPMGTEDEILGQEDTGDRSDFNGHSQSTWTGVHETRNQEYRNGIHSQPVNELFTMTLSNCKYIVGKF